jgi:predicted PurR-regulated permease PerM
VPFVFAAAIGFVTDPLIRTLQARLGLPRAAVGAVLYVVFLALAGAAAYWVFSSTLADLRHVLADAPQMIGRLIREAVGPHGLTVFGSHYAPQQLTEKLFALAAGLAGTGVIAKAAGSGLYLLFAVFLLIVLTPYFMISGPRLAAGTIWLLPPERRHSVRVVLPKLMPVLRRYLVGIFLVVVYTSTVAWIGFGVVFDLPHAPLLSVMVGVLELIPVFGPFMSATIVGIVAIQRNSLFAAGFLMAFAIGLRLSIDNLVGPLLLGQAARVHPVVVMISFVCGAMLFGIVGLLLAVPVAVTIKTTLAHYYAEPIRHSEQQP